LRGVMPPIGLSVVSCQHGCGTLVLSREMLAFRENLAWNLSDPDARAVFLSRLAIRHGAPREDVDHGVLFYFNPQEGGGAAWILTAGWSPDLHIPGWVKIFRFDGEWADCTPQRFWLAMALVWLETDKEVRDEEWANANKEK